MRKSFLYILCFVAVCQLIGCGGGEEQRRQLAELEKQNHSGQPMLNDTLAESLVAYFDRHGNANERMRDGNANERMRAKYILGRTYADMGELPRALETYYEAADCADTTASDCDFAKLSRIHAQSADIFYQQIQPRSELKELRVAEYYAKKGDDSLMAIECYALQSRDYNFLELYDSVIFITEKASSLFNMIGRKDRSVQVLTNDISSLLKKGEITKAMRQICQYEMSSGFFNSDGEIAKGRELFYYLRGKYYLATNQIDSAELLFRKLLLKDKRINSQIAANKGLLEVYEKRSISDSVAKFAKVSYELNDSAYLLSEMQNIQKLQASYNYNHHKFLAEKSSLEARIAWLVLAVSILAFVLVGILFGKKYKTFKRAALDNRLTHADITRRLKDMAIRKSLLLKIFGIEGRSELFDDEIGKIGSKAAG